ncbi:hypothetical protein ACFQMM_15130 [Saliphagus sp. GCM10025308]
MTDDYYTKDDFDDELDLEEDRFDQVPDEDVIEETISNVEEETSTSTGSNRPRRPATTSSIKSRRGRR